MFIKVLIAVLALLGFVAFIIPAAVIYFTGNTQLVQPFGLIFAAAGFVGLLWCIREFYVHGRGTLAPWAPPKKLVVTGLYRCTRNPMYISVALILLGWAISFNLLILLILYGFGRERLSYLHHTV